MITLPHVAGRIFEQPLAIEPRKLDVIIGAISPRLRGEMAFLSDDDEDDDTPPSATVTNGVATISICGTLVSKSGGMNALSGMTSYADIARQFTAAVADPSVTGIVLAIDSPGGEVTGMFDLADMMSAARGVKPICAFCECAASAAYMLASTADKIIVSRTAITGSIGVIAIHMDQSGADEKDGLKYTAIYAGARKNDGNPHAPLSDEAKAGIQSRIDQIYGMFTGAVAKNRTMPVTAVKDTQAAVYMGQAGVDIGLADAVGTCDDAAYSVLSAARAGSKSVFAVTAVPANPKPTGVISMETQTAEQIKASTDAAVATAVAAALAESATITDLCALAGKPELASGYLSAKKTSADVRADLMKMKADEQAKAALNPNVDPTKQGAAGDTVEANFGKAKPWSEITDAINGRKK
ncbi:MAG TPA: S49 family peptidase [Bryobacteraceae bacterium]|jgi:signal peptide peptidase SppA